MLELECPEAPSDTGAYRIAWTGVDGAVRLEENGAQIYEGPDAATTVSGRVAGSYEYTLASGGESAKCTVEVAPPSMGLTLALFVLGFALSAATIGVVVRGHLAHKRGAIG